jgi:hypothetical protein
MVQLPMMTAVSRAAVKTDKIFRICHSLIKTRANAPSLVRGRA